MPADVLNLPDCTAITDGGGRGGLHERIRGATASVRLCFRTLTLVAPAGLVHPACSPWGGDREWTVREWTASAP